MTTKIIFTEEELNELSIGESLTLDGDRGYVTLFPTGFVWTQYVFAGDSGEDPALTSVFIPNK